ncbi:hypothetical protein B0H15DRAFT_953214 [Mycena belliarum]|uniref:DUF6534 domain-containing protein n=1 Tax=Mycena belliarum TaxID=1033014 RepID=A0AAD6XKM4_9AGAR|nr:hypothetical protein B0H15DRAFT_953214 [Mycena belliae]
MPSPHLSNAQGAPDVTLLYGPMLIGVILNTLLYGFMLGLANTYYHRYKSDRRWFRYLILYLVVAETANWICGVGIIYEPLIIRYGTAHVLREAPVMLRSDAIFIALISTPIQFFIAWRIRALTGSSLVPLLICALGVVSLAGAAATSVLVSLHTKFADFTVAKPAILTWLVTTAACDVLLTSALVRSLWTRKHMGAASDDSYLNKIIRLTVQTGAITASAALLDMILFLALPATTVNFMIDFPLSELYTISLISTLNARPQKDKGLPGDAQPNVLFDPSPAATPTATLTDSFSFGHYFKEGGQGQTAYPSTSPTHRAKFTIDADVRSGRYF